MTLHVGSVRYCGREISWIYSQWLDSESAPWSPTHQPRQLSTIVAWMHSVQDDGETGYKPWRLCRQCRPPVCSFLYFVTVSYEFCQQSSCLIICFYIMIYNDIVKFCLQIGCCYRWTNFTGFATFPKFLMLITCFSSFFINSLFSLHAVDSADYTLVFRSKAAIHSIAYWTYCDTRFGGWLVGWLGLNSGHIGKCLWAFD